MQIIAIGNDAVCCQLGKLVEGILHIRQIFEIVQMIRFHIQHDGHRGEEIQERIAILAAFQQDGIAVAHPVAGVQQRQIAADHHRRIHIRFHQNVGQHRCGGGFAVGAGNTDRILVGTHNHTPGLGTLEDRNTLGAGGGNFRIVIMGRCGTNYAASAFDIFCPVANGNVDALGDQFIRRNRRIHIRAGDGQTHSL